MPLVVSDHRGSHNEEPYTVTAGTVKREALTLAIDRGLYEVLNLPPDLPLFDALFIVDQFRRRDLPAGMIGGSHVTKCSTSLSVIVS